jgi:hypothetical protein
MDRAENRQEIMGTGADELERVVEQLRNCHKQATHEFVGHKVPPFRRRRATKHKCGTILFGRRLLCDDCSKSVLMGLGLLDPPK